MRPPRHIRAGGCASLRCFNACMWFALLMMVTTPCVLHATSSADFPTAHDQNHLHPWHPMRALRSSIPAAVLDRMFDDYLTGTTEEYKLPTAAVCQSATFEEKAVCVKLNGRCYSSEEACDESAGTFGSHLCGETCGCCIPSTTPSPTVSVAPTVDHGAERDALLKLFQVTNGPQWTSNRTWNTSTSACDWSGVHCDKHGAVSGLHLIANNMNGYLPAALSNLTQLRTFYIVDQPLLSGTLPCQYGSWGSIFEFYVSNTSISGSLPPEYANWTSSIRGFGLFDSPLIGTLPREYSAWKSLVELSVTMCASLVLECRS